MNNLNEDARMSSSFLEHRVLEIKNSVEILKEKNENVEPIVFQTLELNISLLRECKKINSKSWESIRSNP